MARLRRFVGAFCVVAVTGGAGATASHALFDGDTSIPDNTVTAATVSVSDDDSGSSMFDVSGMRPSDPPRTDCIQVTYDGNVDGVVRLYGSTTGGLAPHVNLKIERGTSCASFTPDATLHEGTLAGLPASYDTGLADAETWTEGEMHAYRLTVSLANDPAAQGLSSQSSFTWEARDL